MTHNTRPNAYADESYTLAAAFNQRVELTPEKNAYTEFNHDTQKWDHFSWAQVRDLASSVQQWLIQQGINKGDRIALMLPNSVMWVAIDLAAAGLGIITVPLYPNDREDNVHYILDNTDCRILFINTVEQSLLSKNFIQEIEALELIVATQPIANTLDLTKQLNKINTDKFICDGCDCQQTATIVFTSGTTGRPKGVVLSHRNLLANASGCGRAVPVDESDRLLSFLPLSHTFERTTGYYAPMLYGAEIVYTRSIDDLAEDLQIMQPTILISVPRIYERVFAKISQQVNDKSNFAQMLFKHAHTIGYLKYCYQHGMAKWSVKFLLLPILDVLVAKKIRTRLGGKLKFAVAGGAAFAKDLNAFFLGMGVNVVQGYGMTESSPVISTNRVYRNIVGSVGEALDNVAVKLSESNELMARGDSIMQGYWRNQQATDEVLSQDGWLHTGDIARIENGVIYITGRVKDIIVLSNGEKIPPADVEHAVCADPLFDQAIVIGERKPFLSAIVVLNQQQCELQAIDPDNINSDDVKADLLQRIAKYMSEFPGYAQVYKITATFDEWTVENGLLTPTLKVKREKVKQLFAQEIEQMYQGH